MLATGASLALTFQALVEKAGRPRRTILAAAIASEEGLEYAKKHFEKSVKKTLTIPSWLNELAVANGINFSQVLQTALKDKLNVN